MTDKSARIITRNGNGSFAVSCFLYSGCRIQLKIFNESIDKLGGSNNRLENICYLNGGGRTSDSEKAFFRLLENLILNFAYLNAELSRTFGNGIIDCSGANSNFTLHYFNLPQ